MKTVKTVSQQCERLFTGLKPGMNEKRLLRQGPWEHDSELRTFEFIEHRVYYEYELPKGYYDDDDHQGLTCISVRNDRLLTA